GIVLPYLGPGPQYARQEGNGGPSPEDITAGFKIVLGSQWESLLKTGLRELVKVNYKELGMYDFMRILPLLQALSIQPQAVALHQFSSNQTRRLAQESYVRRCR
ncbi:unnamed protein product, partial [Amoebophrya sp. A25]